mmetsp:Transcript_27912/g.67913  ORF Transcript_27912/g.67913 Transcript_27912/m.67913 type:complete len:350 (+) Transcript_27912:85-1134(+)
MPSDNTSSNNNSSNDIPEDVRPYDILCGRSKTCFNNIGNRRFRITISMNVKKYDSLTNRSERGNFIYTLAQTLKEDAGFRFVRISKKSGRVELTDDEIRAKIGHALRDLSKAQAEATAAAAKPAEEAKKFMESKQIQQPLLNVVTPTSPARALRKDVSSDIRQEMMMTMMKKKADTNTNTHHHHHPAAAAQTSSASSSSARAIVDDDDDDISAISEMTPDQDDIITSTLPQHEMLHPADREEEEHSMKMPAKMTHHQEEEESTKKPAPIPNYYAAQQQHHSHNNNKASKDELGDDDYCLMPLQFEDELMMMEPASKSTFDMASSTGTISLEDDISAEFLRRCSLDSVLA